MTYDGPTAPPPPDAGGSAAQPGQPPATIRRAVQMVWAVVALSVVNTVLTFVYLDDLVASALEGQPQQGLTEASARTSVIVGGVFGLVFAALWVLLAVLLRRGANWARIVLTVLAGIGLLVGLFGLSLSTTPAPFVVVSVITLVPEAALLYLLWQRDSSRYLKIRPSP